VSTGDWPAAFPRSDVVLVIPPFAPTFQPSLACHLLQACARARGVDVTVVYGNLLFASMVGHRAYEDLLEKRLCLEHVFRHAAFGFRDDGDAAVHATLGLSVAVDAAETWLLRLGEIVRAINPVIVGATCSFEQISSSVAVLNRCKAVNPRITTVIGGANCEGDMADGILSLGGQIDYVASGESEQTFPALVEGILRDGAYPERVVRGTPCTALDDLPRPQFDEYFAQYDVYLPEDDPARASRAVPYESSRGCWWGQKHHCTFCGLNGMSMGFREKTPERVVDDLKGLFHAYPVTRVNFVDNIMPSRYYSTLLPRLANELPPDATLFYEQKSNISFRKATALKAGHVTAIQPGIESLNSHILRCMDKGVKGYQNVALLRYARSLNLRVTWNLLAGFPGDRPEDYQEMADLLPHIVHLEPPDGLGFVRIDRFSPYFDHPERYGISNLRPKTTYFEIFPPSTEHDRLAYYFDGDYDCGAFRCPTVLETIREQTDSWRRRWSLNPKPMLAVVGLVAEQYVLVDTRQEDGPPRFDVIDDADAAVLVLGAPLEEREKHRWAIDRQLLFELDDRLIPLATAHPAILLEFENRVNANGVAPAMSPLLNACGSVCTTAAR
jgi:ribosomal peptide maturation radical SAM protein 1